MPATEPRRSLDDLARLAEEVFERRVRPTLGPGDVDRFLALDVDSGEHEIDEDDYAAVMRLRGRCPSAEIWLMRVGHPAAYRMRRGR
jgi:hypothetical protein